MERNSFLIVAKEVLADKRLSATEKLLLAQLCDHRNKQTGQCNPKQTTLAQELGIGLRTVERCLSTLSESGMIVIKRGQNGCRYEIPTRQNGGSHPPNSGVPTRQNGGSGPPYPLYEPYIREPGGVRAQNRRAPAGSPSNKKTFNTALPPRKTMAQATLEAYYRNYGGKEGQG